MVGGVADHLHRMADHLAARTPVTVMTTVPFAGASWPHAYRLVALDPLPDRRAWTAAGRQPSAAQKTAHRGSFPGIAPVRRPAPRHASRQQSGDDVAVVIGIWDTASHFWCDACHRAGVPYYIVAHGVELLVEPVRPPAALETARLRAIGPRHRQQPRHRSPGGGYVHVGHSAGRREPIGRSASRRRGHRLEGRRSATGAAVRS